MILLSAVVPSSAANADYMYTPVEPPFFVSLYSYNGIGINDSGQVVGSFTTTGQVIGSFNEHGFLYSYGSYTLLDVPGVTSTTPIGINNAGQVVGSYERDASGQSHGFLYSNGSFMPLDVPGATSTAPIGINNAGQVVGSFSTNPTPYLSHGFLYSNGRFTQLDVPGAMFTIAAAINNAGQVVGSFAPQVDPFPFPVSHTFLYNNGTFTQIDPPNTLSAGASGINDAGQVVGSYADSTSQSHGFLYSNGGFTQLDVPGASRSGAAGVNNAGQVVGFFDTYLPLSATPKTAGFVASPPDVLYPNILNAAVLPGSRSVQVGATATAFATIVNSGPGSAVYCTISAPTTVPVAFAFQTTDPRTNALTGTPNTPVDIQAGGSQSFVLALTPNAPIAPIDIPLMFDCANAGPATFLFGINTLNFSASTSLVADIITVAISGDPGYVDIPGATGAGVFAVATFNLGSSAPITASADTGASHLSATPLICQTVPQSGICMAPPTASVSTTINANETPTFGIFVQGSGTVPDLPAVNRVFVRFTDGSGILRGQTSVAVRTK
jgi:probable HAF family extracellular repeat protein